MHVARRLPRFLLATTTVLLALPLGSMHCAADRAPDGLRATPPGTGPQIVFDLERRPLPEIPQPNDVATFADPTSRTGRRINVSMVAPTSIEAKARQGFADMEGWGTFAPITVAFAHGEGADARDAAIDLADVRARMARDGHDLTNDPVYVVNLTTGVPVLLDVGSGNFPVVVRDPTSYWPNDPKVAEQNLLFETSEEGAGLAQSDYTPALDRDFDGVLDHPNTLGPLAPGGIHGIDDLLTWYERETDTLILRPLVPMKEKTEYAVVVTDRLHGPDGQAARSPFPFVHHPEQKDSVAKLASILRDPARANYYGDLAGSGLDHVAFAWTFTTQPTYEDMRLLRDGLYGRGPFARLGQQFPPKASVFRAVGLRTDPAEEPADMASQPACQTIAKWPYAVNVAASGDLIKQITDLVLKKVFTLTDEQEKALIASFQNIDHFVLGSFESPYLIGDDPAHEDPDDWFHLNFKTGEGRVSRDQVHFILTVPKATATTHQPFPTATWAHGTGLFDAQAVIRSGHLAKQGIATFAIDMPGHGLALDNGLQAVAEIFLRASCYTEWLNGLVAGRAHDLNGDGFLDSGGYIWTAHLFHNRDNIRQAVVDQMQAVRLLKSFDGVARSDQDFNGDGAPDLAGDFDGDGTPDIGGSAPITTGGDSLGGIVAMIHGAVDPYVVASAPVSGGGGLLDVAVRSQLTPTPVLEQTFSPLVIAVPASERPDGSDTPTTCASGQSSLRFVVNDLFDSREIELACLDPAELGPDMTVLVIDLTNRLTRCARTTAGGRLRVSIPANTGDRLQVQMFARPDAVTSYDSCAFAPGGSESAGRLVNTWERAATRYVEAVNGNTCTADLGCAQFRDQFFEVGSALVAPQTGIGYARQTPDARRLLNLSQASVDPADAVNFASHYMLEAIPGLDGEPLPPRGILVNGTVGDPTVPIATAIAFARAAGAVPFLPPSAALSMPEYADYATPQALADAFGATPNDVLVDNHVVEGMSRLQRTHGGTGCTANFLPITRAPSDCGALPSTADICAGTLFDADWHAEGLDLFAAGHPAVPLRLARLAAVRATDAASLARTWSARTRILAPGAPDDAAGAASQGPAVALVNAYVNPLGQHVFKVADPCKAWDDVTYYSGLLARFLATGGQDVYFLSHPQTHHCLATQTCTFP